jgi:20S proteasome alpha/beta subunit
MTLVIYVPFKNGSIMISDRQNTYFQDLTREPIDKIVTLPNFRAVLGFAGPTQQCRYLIDQLKRDKSSLLFEKTYEEVYQKCYGFPELGFRSDDVELLVVARKSSDRGFVVRKILGAVMNEIYEEKCAAIGGGSKYIVPQLQLSTLTISRDEAEEFGLTLLAYTSMIDISVGNPITYGYNLVFIGTEIGSVLTRYPKSLDVKKLLYKFNK